MGLVGRGWGCGLLSHEVAAWVSSARPLTHLCMAASNQRLEERGRFRPGGPTKSDTTRPGAVRAPLIACSCISQTSPAVQSDLNRSKTDPRNSCFGFVAKHRFHFIVGRPRTHVISRLDFGSRVYLRAQWELARSLAERRLLAERECLGRCARVGGHLHLHGDALQPRATCQSVL